jgi:hypothetical protein
MRTINEITLALQRGWQIFPLVHTSRFAIEQPLLKQATSSVEQIEAWLKQYPDCGWAVATGEKSGVFAVEFTRDMGIETMRSLCEGDFTAMDTLQTRTAKQITMFFRWPDGGLPASRREQIAEGIAIRHSDGYADLPVGIGATGSQSTYSNLNEPIQNAPAWLLDHIIQAFAKRRTAEVIAFPSRIADMLSVGLSFALRDGMWVCDFYAMEEEGALVKTLPFRFSSSILRLAERGGVAMNAENQEWLNHSFRKGSGIILLTLTNQQYEKLLAA